jgi:tRNA1(Val) A37 N6-methylase TrmN6
MSERIDDLQISGLKLIQDTDLFCFGTDAVLLANFCKVKKGERLLELCAGNGIISILLSAKTNCDDFTMIEIQQKNVLLARRNVELNNLKEKIRVVEMDLKYLSDEFKKENFNVVCVNPPYIKNGNNKNFNTAVAESRHEILCSIDNVCESSSKSLKYGGRFYMVHRPERLADVLYSMRTYGIEAKVLTFVHSYIKNPPILFLVEGLKGGKANMRITKPLIIYNEHGKYTDEAAEIYGL